METPTSDIENATVVYEDERTKIWQYIGAFKDSPCVVGGWVIWAPWMHPAWQYHSIGVIHLRPTGNEAEDEALYIDYPEATHEFAAVALNPDYVPDDFLELRWMSPINIAQQFTAKNDATALRKIELLILQVGTDHISLGSDARNTWHNILRG